MNPILFITDYIQWHYGTAFQDILRVWRNFMWFILHTSSFFGLLMTLIAPWKRIHEDLPKKGTFDPSYYLGSILINILMRFIGLFVRLIIISISLLFLLVAFSVGVVFIIFWFIAPAAIIFLLINGFYLLF